MLPIIGNIDKLSIIGYGWRRYNLSTWMATEIVILVGNTIGGTITEINGDAVADVDHDVIDNMNGRHP